MAVSMYFGLPGCGKTTILSKLAYKECTRRKKRYKRVYCNVPLFGLDNCTTIKNGDIGTYYLRDSLILIDEGTLFANNRDYKNFTKELTEYFLLHRHYNVDIVIFAQQWDGVDKKIRVITDRVYYVFKPLIFGHWFSRIWRIPYGILIPSKKETGNSKYGEIIQGYVKPPLLVRLFSPMVFRPKYYRYFDSWSHKVLPDLPDERYKSDDIRHNEYKSYLVDLYTSLCAKKTLFSFLQIRRIKRLYLKLFHEKI